MTLGALGISKTVQVVEIVKAVQVVQVPAWSREQRAWSEKRAKWPTLEKSSVIRESLIDITTNQAGFSSNNG
jgi:hypothetical protein